MSWITKKFETDKPIIAMCHLLPLPNEPGYNKKLGIKHIINCAKKDIETLQNNNIDGILFSNEFGYPYSQDVSKLTVATMARVIGELKRYINVPIGVDCMYDALSTIDLASATDSDFYRITLQPSFPIDYELGLTRLGEYFRYANKINLDTAMALINIDPSMKLAQNNNNIETLVNTISTQLKLQTLCISANTLENLYSCDYECLKKFKKNNTLICDGGCNEKNIKKIMELANGVIVGTTLKSKQILTNQIDSIRVEEFIKCAKNNS